jgi:uncharacterized protein with HEPN domain
MTRRDPDLALRHIVDHAREALAMIDGRTRQDLNDDRQLELSVVRLLEIIGEAASRLPAEIQAKYPDVPWPEVISLRNRLIHGYDAVDLDIVWAVLTDDLPSLLDALKKGEGSDPPTLPTS